MVWGCWEAVYFLVSAGLSCFSRPEVKLVFELREDFFVSPLLKHLDKRCLHLFFLFFGKDHRKILVLWIGNAPSKDSVLAVKHSDQSDIARLLVFLTIFCNQCRLWLQNIVKNTSNRAMS